MSYRSTRKYIPDLLIQAKDTDPDLRFMALNDLEKEFENISGPYVYLNNYAETILKCLDDEFVEVRTQSLKCFETIGPKLGDILFSVISQLMTKIKKPKKLSITSNIYTMALHNLLKNLACSKSIYSQAIEIIVPEILRDEKAFYLEIDYIEILTDVCEYLGKCLSKQKSLEILLFLADAVFGADTIIAKKSIFTANILLRNISEPQTISLYVKQLTNNYQKHTQIHTDTENVKIKLLIALSGSISGNPSLFQKHVAFIWDTACQFLQLDTLQVVDDDYELQQKKDAVRVEAIVLLEKLFASLNGADVEPKIPRAIEICELCATYDPYQSNTLNEEEEDDDDGYSDYDDEYACEQDDDDDDDSDISSAWKLRAEGFSLLITLVTKFPLKLPLVFNSIFGTAMKLLSVERHVIVLSKLVETISLVFELSSETGSFYNIVKSREMVSASCKRSNSDVSLYTDEDPYAYLSCNSATISDAIIHFIQNSNSFVNEKPELVISLISNWVSAVGDLNGYIEKLVVAVNEAWKTQLVSNDIFTFYYGLIKNNPLRELGSGLQYLISYLHKCLSDNSNYRLVNESLTLLTEIYQGEHAQSDTILTQIAESFAPFLINMVLNGNDATEIRLKSLNILVLMLLRTNLNAQLTDEILQIFNKTLSTEVLTLKSLNLIVKIVLSPNVIPKLSKQWVDDMINKSLEYFKISELASSAVKAASALFETNMYDNTVCGTTLFVILKLHSYSIISEENCKDIGNMLIHILDSCFVCSQFDTFMPLLFDLAFFDNFDEILPQLMKKLLNQTDEENIANAIRHGVKNSDFIKSKLLAVLTVTSGNNTSINQMLVNLEKNENVYFSLVFLNQVSKSYDIGVGITRFIALFNCNDKAVVNITIKLVATLISKFPDRYLAEYMGLLAQIQHLAPAFQTLSLVLDNVKLDQETAKNILQVIVNIENERGCVDLDNEYKYSAQCIGKLVVAYHLIDFMIELMMSALLGDQRVLVALSESAKFFFSNYEVDETEILEYADLTTIRLMFISNLKLKEIGASNLNLILTKIPSLAITLINNNFKELIEKEAKPNKDFIHTQFIGPYKHKIDDALNYRKQVFEIIYYLLKTVEDSKTLLLLANIDWRLYFNSFFDSGVKDDQSIASVCLLATLKIFEIQNTLFSDSHGDIDVFELFLTRCKKVLNKKLSDTAVKQDIEKQNTLIKMIIRFLKKVDSMILIESLVLTNTQKNLWISFINDTKAKFPVFDDEE